MLIGVCGAEFPEVREALGKTIPGVEFKVIPHERAFFAPVKVDVLLPLGGRVDGPLLDATRPRLVQQFGVGVQGVSLDAARERGIPVANVPAADTGNAVAVAEAAVMLLLILLRRFPELQRSVAGRIVGQPVGSTLDGKKVVILGTGAIGRELITRLAPFGVSVTAVSRRPYPELPAATRAVLSADRYSVSLPTALGQADALIVAVPLTKETSGIVDEAAIAAMRPGGHLVNVGRGGVVSYAALLGALRSGQLAGAGLDVTWEEPIDPADELLTHPNVVVTPHIAGVTHESYAKMAAAFAANVARLEAGAPLEHVVG